MIFKSKQVNTDPEPWVAPNGKRGATNPILLPNGNIVMGEFDPRPEFNVTRDPEPCRNEDSAERLTAQEAEQDRATGWEVTFDPRPEFDHPVNRILAGVREDVNNSADLNHDTKATAEFWLSFSDDWDKDGLNATPDEIAHARRVLTRLANGSAT